MFRKKILDPLLALLKQGMSPESLSLTIAIGAVVSICPLFGVTTWICALVALIFRLNPIAIQVANYAAYPAQLVLLIPFFRAGEKLFGISPTPLSVEKMNELFRQDWKEFVKVYGMLGLRGAVAWAIVAPFVIVALRFALLPILKRLKKNPAP